MAPPPRHIGHFLPSRDFYPRRELNARRNHVVLIDRLRGEYELFQSVEQIPAGPFVPATIDYHIWWNSGFYLMRYFLDTSEHPNV